MKKTLLALSVAGLLTACGGSDGTNTSTGSDNTDSSSFKVIDGYLSGAEVCVIAEGADICTKIGETDENGSIDIPAGTTGQLVATIIAGKTLDADSVGFVDTTYQMLADIKVSTHNVITPYTTLDALDPDKSIADIAAELGLNVDVINGDYVASTSEEKETVHAIARVLASKLNESKDENEPATLLTHASDVKAYIDDNKITELSNAYFSIDSNNIVTHSFNNPILNTFIANNLYVEDDPDSNLFHLHNLNEIRNESENFGVGFTSGTNISIYNIDSHEKIDAEFTTEGNIINLSIDDEIVSDEFIYVGDSLALVVTSSDSDLITYVDSDADDRDIVWSVDYFIENTFYYIFDDSDSDTPKPAIIDITFAEDGTAIMHDQGPEENITWEVDGLYLTLYFDANDPDDSITILKYVAEGDITLFAEKAEPGYKPSSYGLMSTNQTLAKQIFNRWNTLAN